MEDEILCKNYEYCHKDILSFYYYLYLYHNSIEYNRYSNLKVIKMMEKLNEIGYILEESYSLYEDICPIRLSGKKVISFPTFLEYLYTGMSMDLELIEIINLLLRLPGVSKIRKKNIELYMMILSYNKEKRNSQS